MSEEDLKRRRADDFDDKWHLDKKVPVGIIGALVVQAAIAVWAFASVQKDVEYLKVEMQLQRDRDDKQDRLNADSLTTIRADIKGVGEKLDRLIERSK